MTVPAMLAALLLIVGPGAVEAQVAAELTPVVRAIEAASRARDPAPIAAFIHRDGLPGGDDLMPRVEVLRDIEKSGGWLNAFFFDGPTLRREFKDLDANMSLLEFEQKAKTTTLEFVDIRFSKSGALGASCVRLHAAGVAYAPKLCFFREGGKWYLASAGRFGV